MKRYYGFHSLLFTIMILIITGKAGAFLSGDGIGAYARDRKQGIRGNEPTNKSSISLIHGEAVPEGLTKIEWGKIRANIERDQYRLHMGKNKNIYHAMNPAQGMSLVFTPQGLEVKARSQSGARTWRLQLKGYGYGRSLHDASAVEGFVVQDNRIEYHRGELIEWYINDHRGLEQGFTLQQKPEGSEKGTPLKLHLKSMSDFVPESTRNGKAVTWKNEHGETVLRYSGLIAYDAAGAALGARMEADQEGIRLFVDDDQAVYPITIDPFIGTKKLLASDGAAEDKFGHSVSIDGDTVIVGAPYDNDYFNQSGSAYIFYRDYGGTNNWGVVKKLHASDGAAGDWFGFSVSISGYLAIVGAYGNDDSGDETGSAYIFSRNLGGTNNWGEVQKLTGADAGDYFGHSVSISESRAIVGAYRDGDMGDDSGSAYIFKRLLDLGGGEYWLGVQKLTASDGVAGDRFGYSVSISGDWAIVGAPYEGISGSAYTFYRDQGGADNWGEVDKLTVGDGGSGVRFGNRVSLSADTAIVGDDWDDDKGIKSGSAHIFMGISSIPPCPDWSGDVVLSDDRIFTSGMNCECVGSLSVIVGGSVAIQSGASLSLLPQ